MHEQPDVIETPGLGLLSRRNAVLGGLIAAFPLARAGGAVLPPTFSSGGHQFTLLSPRRALPSIRLFGLAGGSVDLIGFRGQPILLNFWATWCAACRTELPLLDQLSEQTRSSGLHVIAVSEDRESRNHVGRFVQSLAIRHLAIFLDPNGYVAQPDPDGSGAPFGLYGMPITYLIASSGLIVGYMPGAADWTSPEAQTLIAFLRTA